MFEDKAWKRLNNEKEIVHDLSDATAPIVTEELPQAKPKRSKTAQKTVITFTGPFHTFSIGLGVRSRATAISIIAFLALFFVFGLISIPITVSSFLELDELAQKTKNAYLTVIGENLNLKSMLKDSEDEKTRQAELEAFLAQNAEASRDITINFESILPEQKTALLKILPNGTPIQYASVSSEFGSRNHPVLGRNSFHEGIDLKADVGTKVHSTAEGIVSFAQYNGGYGNMLIINHSFGFSTVYAHLSKITVKPGEFIAKGQYVANSGSSGLSSGPHLHYEVRFLDRPLNPSPFLAWNYPKFTDIFSKERSIRWGYLIEATKWPQLQQTPQASLQSAQK